MVLPARLGCFFACCIWCEEQGQAGVIGRPFPRSRRSFLLRANLACPGFPRPESAPFPFRSFRLGPARPLLAGPGSAGTDGSRIDLLPGLVRSPVLHHCSYHYCRSVKSPSPHLMQPLLISRTHLLARAIAGCFPTVSAAFDDWVDARFWVFPWASEESSGILVLTHGILSKLDARQGT